MDLQIVFGNPKKKSNKSGGLMAKKKPSKKAKKVVSKATKKAVKKTAPKKAAKKKAAKKVAKKKAVTKVAPKKAAKKASKKVAKKVAKKVTKKVTKKAAPKKAAKKVTKRKASKKPSIKKASKKRSKKVAKKAKIKRIYPKKLNASKTTRKNRKARSKSVATMGVVGKPSKVRKMSTIVLGDKRVKNIRKNRSKAMAKMTVDSSRAFSWASFGAKKGKMKSSRHGGTRGANGLNKAFLHQHKVFRTNPWRDKMKNVEKYLKHKTTEAAGLAIGGFSSEAINNLVLTKMPQVASFMGKWFGRGTGAAINAVVGVGLGVLNEKALKNNPHVDMVAKGIIGSAAVSAGNALYAMTLGRNSMAGFQVGNSQQYIPEFQPETDFGGFITGDSNMGGFITGDSGMGSNADFSGMADFAGYDYDDSDYDAEVDGEYGEGY